LYFANHRQPPRHRYPIELLRNGACALLVWHAIGCGGPAPLRPLQNAAAISVGERHACVLLTDGRAACWGENLSGQLGIGAGTTADGTWTAVNRPVFVKSLPPVKEIAAGGDQTCALLQDGSVDCWGLNSSGGLGTGGGEGTIEYAYLPTPVSDVADVVHLRAVGLRYGKQEYTCGVLANGSVRCWGETAYLRCMSDPVAPGTVPIAGPTPVAGLDDISTVALGDCDACALSKTGRVSCWGEAYFAGGPGPQRQPAAPVDGLTGVRELAAGDQSMCAVLEDGTVTCWGEEDLATGAPRGSGTAFRQPVAVAGLANVTSIAAAHLYACALIADGTVKCWGDNLFGVTGAPIGTNHLSTPRAVAGLSHVVSIGVSGFHACALIADGTVKCWGSGVSGGLGDGAPDRDSAIPVTVVEAVSP
jgi:alpha-tubulin suppressor-like RCC1 family protein